MSKQVRIPEDQHKECEKMSQTANENGLPLTIGKIVEMALNRGMPLLRSDLNKSANILNGPKAGRPRK